MRRSDQEVILEREARSRRVGLAIHILNTSSHGGAMQPDPFKDDLQLRRVTYRPMGSDRYAIAKAVAFWSALTGLLTFAMLKLIGWL
jgi:hypothetical protein